MDNLTLALKLTGKEKTTEEKSELVNPSSASIVYMVAVTASSGGEVVLKDEIDETAEWEEGDYIEVDEDGEFEEYESDDDPLEDVDDSVVDMTDGDGVDIEETDSETLAYSVADYHEDAVAAYSEDEADAVVDDLPDEDTTIDSTIDDGDAEVIPDVGELNEDDIPDENAIIDDLTDDDYTLTDDSSDDESDEIEGAETSDGYTVAKCIGSVKAGDRVAVAVQNGKLTVIGVVGSGDEEVALRKLAEETAAEANEVAESASENANDAKTLAEQANTKADAASKAASEAKTQAASAEASAKSASDSAQKVTVGLQEITTDLLTVKSDASQTLAEAIEANTEKKVEVMTASYATKNELKEQKVDLKGEIERSAGKIQTTLSASYTRKTDLTEAKVEMQSQISQTAEAIELTVLDITDAMANTHDETVKAQIAQAKTDFENAKASLATAKTNLAEAQKNEQIAKDNAAEAQNALSDANAELASAQSDLTKAQSYYDRLVELGASTEEIEAAEADVEEAESAVATATTKVNTATADLNSATAAITTAQNAVTTAEANVESAQQSYDLALNGLHSYNMTAIKQTADAINLKASKTDLDGYVKTTTFQVTANGFTTEINTAKKDAAAAQTAADNAATAAGNAQSTADTARTEAAAAAKTATNFLSYDATNGLLVGNKTSGSWSGSRAQILPTAFNILDADGTALASYQSNKIDLGMNSEETVINLCGGNGSIKSTEAGSGYQRMTIETGDSINLETSGEIVLNAYAEETSGGYVRGYAGVRAKGPWGLYDQSEIYLALEISNGTYIDVSVLTLYERTAKLSAINNSDGKRADITLQAGESGGTCSINADSVWISGNVTTYGDITLGTNNKSIIGTDTDGADRRLLVLNTNNNCVINYDSYAMSNGNAHIYGNEVRFFTNGYVYSDSTIVFDNAKGIRTYLSDGSTTSSVIYVSASDNLIVGTTTGINNLYLYTKSFTLRMSPPDVGSSLDGYFYPVADGTVACGTSVHKWYRLYATSATVQTSDERQKENIVPLGANPIMTLSLEEETTPTDIHSELFDRLIPVQYNFIKGDGKTCFGLIAQQVLSAMEELGISEHELDLVHHDTWTDEETGEAKDSYGMAYENIIALLIHEVQKIKTQIS